MVAAVRQGESQRAVARRFGVSLATVQLWLARAGSAPLEVVDWADHSSAPHHVQRTAAMLEDRIVELRQSLRRHSVLGEFGAAAIQRELLAEQQAPRAVPSVRTIGRVLERRGAVDGRWRSRRRPPPPGWYLPDVAARLKELDSFDFIEGLRLPTGLDVDVLTGVSLHGGLNAAWPSRSFRATEVVTRLDRHWLAVGLPGYAQFDNDPRFIGSGNRPDAIGQVIRRCLALGVVPVFAPPLEVGFQAAVENLNGRWQAKLWMRFGGLTMLGLQRRSAAWVAASRRRAAARIEAAPARAPYPRIVPERALRGRIVFLRRTDRWGAISVLNRRYPVDRTWVHRLIRADFDLAAGQIRCYALRRREPADQPLMREIPHRPPERWFE